MRYTKDVVIDLKGRDLGKVYVVTEMDAAGAEWWAMRALMALAKSGLDIGEAQNMGMRGLAVLGIQSLFKLPPNEIKPLLDEMWKCVAIRPDPKNNPTFVRSIIADDIEEVATRLHVRAEILALHTGFSIPGFLLSSPKSEKRSPGSQSTPTSQPPSHRSSRLEKRA